VGDSLDLVVLGAYHGRGKRTGAYGGFLLGCYNADSEEYQTVCKIGTGFSDENLDKFYKELSELIVSEKKSYVQHDDASNQQPDIWFEPKVVWEILTADLSLSPVYRAGIDELGKGVSLRFPRFIRVRDDKGPEDATTTEQIVQFYQRQVSQHKHENGDEE
jgi:DNA ligase-1